MSECSESFVFYRSFLDAIQEMNPNDQLETLLAICRYAIYGEEPEMHSMLSRAIFTIAKPSLDANKTKRTSGKKGGRPKKKTNGFKNEKPMVIENEKPTDTENENHRFSENESTVTETVTETVTDTVTDTVTETETGTETEAEKKAAKPQRSNFVKPTVDEIREYCRTRNNSVDPESFHDFYASKGWKIGKDPMKDWKAAVRTWERRGDGKRDTGQKQYSDPEELYR